MQKLLIAALAAFALSAGAALSEEPGSAPAAQEPAFAYTVVREDARIPFGPRQLDHYRVGRDGSLILRAGVNRWYRATLFAPCARDLRWEHDIGVFSRGGGSVDRFSYAIVDGRRCAFRTLDEIADPRETERAADAAQAHHAG